MSSARVADAPPVPDWLKVGARVVDTRSDRVGVVMSISLRLSGQPSYPETRVWLRPPKGGREWEARPKHLAPVPDGTP